MKIIISTIIFSYLALTQVYSQEQNKKERKLKFNSDTSFSLISVTGNSNNSSLKFLTVNRLPLKRKNNLNFGGHWTKAFDKEELDALNWDINLKYLRKINETWGTYLGAVYEVDEFAGNKGRWNFDYGAFWEVIDSKDTDLEFQLGYRWMNEDDTDDNIQKDSKLRFYGKWEQNVLKNFGFTLWAEYLPNFSRPDDWMFNMEPSVWVNIIDILAFKIGYKWLYRGLPPDKRVTTDVTATSSLLFRL